MLKSKWGPKDITYNCTHHQDNPMKRLNMLKVVKGKAGYTFYMTYKPGLTQSNESNEKDKLETETPRHNKNKRRLQNNNCRMRLTSNCILRVSRALSRDIIADRMWFSCYFVSF